MTAAGVTPFGEAARRGIRIRNEYVKGAIGEVLGTGILMFFVCGSGMQGFVQKGNDSMQPILGQMFGLLAAILITAGASGAHFNPAITIGFAMIGQCKWSVLPLYTICQMLGAYIGAGLAAACYAWIPLSEGKTFSEYFTDANIFAPIVETPIGSGFLDQIMTTGILMMTLAACVDKRNLGIPKYLVGFYLILTVSAIIMCFGVNAGAALNPARDLGPRLMAWSLGYDKTYIFMNNGGNTHWWTVGFFGPLIGAPLGAFLYIVLVGIHLNDPEEDAEKVEENNNNQTGWRATQFVPKVQSPVIPTRIYDEAPLQYPQAPQNQQRQNVVQQNGQYGNPEGNYGYNNGHPGGYNNNNFVLRDDMKQRQGY